jgi:hypothetical protein
VCLDDMQRLICEEIRGILSASLPVDRHVAAHVIAFVRYKLKVQDIVTS